MRRDHLAGQEVLAQRVHVRSSRRGARSASPCRACDRRRRASPRPNRPVSRRRPTARRRARAPSSCRSARHPSPSVPTNVGVQPSRRPSSSASARTERRSVPVMLRAKRRGVGEGERRERRGVGIALPDAVHVSHRQVDRCAVEQAPGEVDEDAVAKVDRVVEPEQDAPRSPSLRGILEDALASHARGGVFADWRQRIPLPATRWRRRG